MVPHGERACPETCETPGHGCIRTMLAQASHAIYDMLAIHVAIVHKSCRGEDRRPQSVPCVAGSVARIAVRLHGRPPGGVAVGFRGRGDVCPKERGEVTLVHAPHLGPNLDEGHVGVGEQPLGVRDPAQVHVLVGRPPGRVLE